MSDSPLILQKARTWEVCFFGFQTMGAAIVGNFISSYLMFFLTDFFGIAAAAAGSIFLLSKLFDAASDPLIGILADRTSTRFGRYRPWIWVGAPLLSVFLVMLFWAPDLPQNWKIFYVAAVYFALTWAYTMTGVPSHAMKAEMTQDPVQRAKYVVPASVGDAIGSILGVALVVPLLKLFGGGIPAYRTVVALYGVLACGAFYMLTISFKRYDRPEHFADKPKVRVKDMLSSLKENKALRMLSLSVSTNYMSSAATSAVAMYILTYIMKDQGLMFTIGAIGLGMMIPMSLLVMRLSRRFSKKRIFTFGSWAGIAVPLILLLVPAIFEHRIAFIALIAVNAGLAPFTGQVVWTMLPDAVDYGEWRTGSRVNGAVIGAFSFFNRLGTAFGAWIVGIVLGLVGYVGGAEIQTPIVEKTIIWIYCLVPIVGHLASIIAMRFYPITREFYYRMMEDLHEGKRVPDDTNLKDEGFQPNPLPTFD